MFNSLILRNRGNKKKLMRETAAAENNLYEEQVKWEMQDFGAETNHGIYGTQEHTKP